MTKYASFLKPSLNLSAHFSGKWQRNKYVGVSLVGKTLAVMGFGKVGSEVARRAKGLGMHVIAHDPYAPADRARAIGAELVSFDEAISTADFISLHMPLTPTTSKVFNDASFAKMKKGVRIINVARGGVIDEDALVRALDSGLVSQVILTWLTETCRVVSWCRLLCDALLREKASLVSLYVSCLTSPVLYIS